MSRHTYEIVCEWIGAGTEGTRNYRSYSRDHRILADGAPPIEGSSDPAFRGDPSRHNPEQLLLASISSCHMLWYLHLAATNGITVLSYVDRPTATMEEAPGNGRFTEALLRPEIAVARGADLAVAAELHGRAHGECFVANSLNFPVRCAPEFREVDGPPPR